MSNPGPQLNPRSRAEAPAPQPASGSSAGTSGKAIAGLVLGILGLVGAFFVFPPLVFSTLAIVFGALGRSDAQRHPELAGETMGLVAILLGVAGFALAVAWVAVP